jgi:6-phosphogluconolactonase
MPERIDIFTAEDLGNAVVSELVDRLGSSTGLQFLALSGGRTVGPIYERLACAPVDWSRVAICQTDERGVPPFDSRSNFRLIRDTLIEALPQPPSAVMRMEAEQRDSDMAARDYEEMLPLQLDIALLGIGEDGHVASVFPGQHWHWTTNRRVSPGVSPDGLSRMTLSPTYIANSKLIILVASGMHKALAVEAALAENGDERTCPARIARHGVWLLDEGAASHLRHP